MEARRRQLYGLPESLGRRKREKARGPGGSPPSAPSAPSAPSPRASESLMEFAFPRNLKLAQASVLLVSPSSRSWLQSSLHSRCWASRAFLPILFSTEVNQALLRFAPANWPCWRILAKSWKADGNFLYVFGILEPNAYSKWIAAICWALPKQISSEWNFVLIFIVQIALSFRLHFVRLSICWLSIVLLQFRTIFVSFYSLDPGI